MYICCRIAGVQTEGGAERGASTRERRLSAPGIVNQQYSRFLCNV